MSNLEPPWTNIETEARQRRLDAEQREANESEAAKRREARRAMRREERMLTRAASPTAVAPVVDDEANEALIRDIGYVIGRERKTNELARGALKLDLQVEINNLRKELTARIDLLKDVVTAALRRDTSAAAETRKDVKALAAEVTELRDALVKLAKACEPAVKCFSGQ